MTRRENSEKQMNGFDENGKMELQKSENNPIENEIRILESTISGLTKEIKEIQTKNEKIRETINKKPFYREFELMGKEEEGLKKQNQSLVEMIKREQEKKKGITN